MSLIRADSIPQMLSELTRARFWGSVQIDYQNGQPVLVRKTETFKPLESTRGNTREYSER
jgi:hypothetical protein